MVMSAFHPKADMCSAFNHVCFVPIADIRPVARLVRQTRFSQTICPPPKVLFSTKWE